MIILKLILLITKYVTEFTNGLLRISFRKYLSFSNHSQSKLKQYLAICVNNIYHITKLIKHP
jgi:hypothetical protein